MMAKVSIQPEQVKTTIFESNPVQIQIQPNPFQSKAGPVSPFLFRIKKGLSRPFHGSIHTYNKVSKTPKASPGLNISPSRTKSIKWS